MNLRSTSCAAAAYAALAVAATFPLILHLGSTIPHDLGDPLLSATLLWWNAHVVPLTSRWWDGFAFFPGGGMVAFSDHRLGLGLLATPLQWAGCTPITAYNVTLLATFPLCAVAAHAAAFTLTRRHDAAAICGLAYGFNPYRFAHIEHLELLASFGMPAALAALHAFMRTRRTKWIVVFATALLLQALCASYYALFFTVLLALWIVWFVPGREWRRALLIVGSAFCAALPLVPIAIGYSRIHQHFGLQRTFGEMTQFSADVSSFLTASPLSALWRWTAPLNVAAERQLFPGLTILVLAAVGGVAAIRRHRERRELWADYVSLALIVLATVFAAVAISVHIRGPWELALGPLSVSGTVVYKPLSIAFVALIASAAVRGWARAAVRQRSPFAFYAGAAILLFICALGPKPTFLGAQVLYEPPYAWLIRLPIFGDSVRVPARFAMPAALALALAAALAFDRLAPAGSRRRQFAVASMIAIIADGWIVRLPLPTMPPAWPAPAVAFGAVLELPVNQAFSDFIAMYRASTHQHPTVNGASGYFPPHYKVLELAMEEGDETILEPLAALSFASRPLLVVVDRRADSDRRWEAFVTGAARSTVVNRTERWTFITVRPTPATDASCGGSELPIGAITTDGGQIDPVLLTDRNPSTWWAAPGPQRVGQMLTVDLRQPYRVCAVRLSVGASWERYPRALSVSTSLDASHWTLAFRGKTAGAAFRGAVDRPRDIWIDLPMTPGSARFVRLQLEADRPSASWLVGELRVVGSP